MAETTSFRSVRWLGSSTSTNGRAGSSSTRSSVVGPVQSTTSATHQPPSSVSLLEFAQRHPSRVADRAAELGLATDDVGRVETRADAAIGRRVSAEDFVGRCWDWHRGQLIWPYREGPNGVRARGWGGTTSVTSGYADAFMDPPYGMRATFEQVGAWFDAINEHLLGGLAADLVVYDWSGTWSTYFDAGREWWGSFLWTVEPAARQWIAVIGASSTD